jgi:ABC-type antimicrobial peptide transport system permease subunit
MEEALAGSIRQRRFSAWTYGGIGVAALVTIGVGILGMVAMITSLRVREIGIRQALGASRGGVIKMLLREQLTGVVVGLLAGGGVAWWASGLLRREVYGMTATDPLLWTVAALTILTAASLATIVPALHASRLDPATTLRAE